MDTRWSEVDREAVGLFEERFGRPAGLEELVRRFSSLPYENLSKILAWDGGQAPPSPRLPRRVMREHLEVGTGGTCFSLTELLRQLAGAGGLEAHPVMAHMRHGANVHCALTVQRAGRRFLVDPGYLVPEPLPLEAAATRAWEVGRARLVRAGSLTGVPAGVPEGALDLYTMEPEGPRWRYRLDPRPPSAAVFHHHWLESFGQPGMRSLLVTLRDEEGRRLYLHNHKLRILGPEGKVNRNVRATLEQTMADHFGIDPRVCAAAREALRRRRGDPDGP